MALENKLGIKSSAELAREEERISKKKAVELFENGMLEKLEAGKFQTCFFNIISSQMRMLLPFPSRNGCTMFISTYFSTISSNVFCGILSTFLIAVSRYISGANLKLPFDKFTVRIFPAKS